jgi:hypothetical protein
MVSKPITPEEFTDHLLTPFPEADLKDFRTLVAEGEGFEPPDLSVNGFQDRRLKPLGHPSVIEC